MRVLIVNDLHLSDRPPSIRTESYAEDILTKLENTVTIAHNEDVDAVVWAGDVFHIKTPSRTSHRLVRRVMEIGSSYRLPWLIVPGNHDMRHDRLDSIEGQPLGVLYKAGAIPLVGPVELVNPGETVFGIPWLADWQELPKWLSMWRTERSPLIVAHAPITPPGVNRPFDVIDAEDWAKLMVAAGAVAYGHMHQWDGTYQVGDVWFCNEGALSRGSLHEETVGRKPAVTIYDPEKTPPFTRWEVPHRPASEVFRFAIKEAEEARADRLDEFLSRIESTELQGLTVEQVLAHVEANQELRPRTREVIREVIEEAMVR